LLGSKSERRGGSQRSRGARGGHRRGYLERLSEGSSGWHDLTARVLGSVTNPANRRLVLRFRSGASRWWCHVVVHDRWHCRCVLGAGYSVARVSMKLVPIHGREDTRVDPVGYLLNVPDVTRLRRVVVVVTIFCQPLTDNSEHSRDTEVALGSITETLIVEEAVSTPVDDPKVDSGVLIVFVRPVVIAAKLFIALHRQLLANGQAFALHDHNPVCPAREGRTSAFPRCSALLRLFATQLFWRSFAYHAAEVGFVITAVCALEVDRFILNRCLEELQDKIVPQMSSIKCKECVPPCGR
jgi:hypothetical protein